eukprot:scaffold18898_cov29-Tisochrysis_lutea.AAC.5
MGQAQGTSPLSPPRYLRPPPVAARASADTAAARCSLLLPALFSHPSPSLLFLIYSIRSKVDSSGS